MPEPTGKEDAGDDASDDANDLDENDPEISGTA